MDHENDLEEIIKLGNKVEAEMGTYKYQTELKDLQDHLDILFASIQMNLNDIRALKEIIQC